MRTHRVRAKVMARFTMELRLHQTKLNKCCIWGKQGVTDLSNADRFVLSNKVNAAAMAESESTAATVYGVIAESYIVVDKVRHEVYYHIRP